MIKVLIACGTRPEVIKVAPVIKEFKKFPKEFVCKVCITGQHREMIESAYASAQNNHTANCANILQ